MHEKKKSTRNWDMYIFCFLNRAYLIEDPEEIVRPFGSRSQGGVHTDEGVATKRGRVNIMERSYFLIG